VLDLLDQIADDTDDVDENGLGDLGDELLPRLVDDGNVRQYPHREYWRDVGTIDAYWSANMDFLTDRPPIDLDDDAWPIRTQGGYRAPAWLTDTASVSRSLVCSAASVAGEVVNSVLSPGVVIEEGARVEESVLLPGVVVRRGARVRRAVVDDSVDIGANAQVGGAGEITLLGNQARVPEGTHISQASDSRTKPTDRPRLPRHAGQAFSTAIRLTLGAVSATGTRISRMPSL